MAYFQGYLEGRWGVLIHPTTLKNKKQNGDGLIGALTLGSGKDKNDVFCMECSQCILFFGLFVCRIFHWVFLQLGTIGENILKRYQIKHNNNIILLRNLLGQSDVMNIVLPSNEIARGGGGVYYCLHYKESVGGRFSFHPFPVCRNVAPNVFNVQLACLRVLPKTNTIHYNTNSIQYNTKQYNPYKYNTI